MAIINSLNGKKVRVVKQCLMFVSAMFLLTVQLAGCSTIGPSTIDRDRFDYVSAISESWKRQTLLNLIKVRYLDVPVFMDVASVINQYALESEIELGFSWNGGQTRSIGGRGMYTDRPTITYSPLTGEKFARSLLSPLPLTPILMLIQNEYAADEVLRICIQSINGIDNSRYQSVFRHIEDPEFDELVDLFRSVYLADGIAMRSRKEDAGIGPKLIFRSSIDSSAKEDLHQLKELLELDPHVNEFNVVHGKFALDNKEIAILSRSMYQIMAAFAANIETPLSDIAGVQMDDRHQRSGLNETPSRSWIDVQHGKSKPETTFAAVHYRDHWFWIDDRDDRSKSMFNFLMILFSFTERGNSETGAPVITVPTN